MSLRSAYDSFRDSEWSYWEGEYLAGRSVPGHYRRKFDREKAELEKLSLPSGANILDPDRLTDPSVLLSELADLHSLQKAREEFDLLDPEDPEVWTPEPPEPEYVGMSYGRR